METNLLIRNCKIIADGFDEATDYDILIENGKITQIEFAGSINANTNTQVVHFPNLYVSAGWTDGCVFLSEPGNEHRESLADTKWAAAYGGFTRFVGFGSKTTPTIHNAESVKKIILSNNNTLPQCLPVAAATLDFKGEKMTEMYDMLASGAVGFGEGIHSAHNSDIVLKTLQYLLTTKGIFFNHPHNQWLAQGGQVHDGLVSVTLGLKGIPDIAETIPLHHDLEIARYTNGRIHISALTTEKSVEIVREYKKMGVRVTADTTIYNLIFTDADLPPFDTNYKLFPPIRGANDRKALQEALADGTIDFVVSGHQPLEIELKDIEFDYASYGARALETLFPALLMAFPNVPLKTIVEYLVNRTPLALGLNLPTLNIGAEANLTLFNPDAQFIISSENQLFKTHNNPLFNRELRGKVMGVVLGAQFIENAL